MKADDILYKVMETLKQRGTDNGYDQGGERSAYTIAKIFGQKTGFNLSEKDVWIFLMSLKEARLKQQLLTGADPTDTLIDLIGYTTLLAETLTSDRERDLLRKKDNLYDVDF